MIIIRQNPITLSPRKIKIKTRSKAHKFFKKGLHKTR